MSAPKVLVTGCAGYLGSTLVGHLLAANYKVVGVDNLMYANGSALLPYVTYPNFEFHRENVRNWLPVQNLARECDVIIPLAAVVGAPACNENPENARAVNETAVEALVRSLSPNQLVLYPNTNSGYGSTDGTTFCTENDPLKPISTYGETKCAGEKAVLDHERSVSLRLATVFGASPRMRLDLMVNDFTRQLWQNRRISIFESHFKRNFVGVQDVARAFLHMISWLARGGTGGAYNLGLPTANLSKLELARIVAAEVGAFPTAIAEGPGRDPDQRNYLVSNDKILGTSFKFGHELVQGIREVVKVLYTHTSAQLAHMRNY